jgi:hypothetical protein
MIRGLCAAVRHLDVYEQVRIPELERRDEPRQRHLLAQVEDGRAVVRGQRRRQRQYC